MQKVCLFPLSPWLCHRPRHSGKPPPPCTGCRYAACWGAQLLDGDQKEGEGGLDSSSRRAPPRAAKLALALILHQGEVSSATSLSCPIPSHEPPLVPMLWWRDHVERQAREGNSLSHLPDTQPLLRLTHSLTHLPASLPLLAMWEVHIQEAHTHRVVPSCRAD